MWNWLAYPLVLGAVFFSGCPGCTKESTRIAMENIPRVEENQDVVTQNLRETALIFMYADMLNYLQVTTGHQFTKTELEQIQYYWQGRDKIESWLVNWERARALRLLTIDTEIISGQATIDLMLKKLQLLGERTGVTTND